MSVIELLRAVAARRNAIYTYAMAHDHFANEEQTFSAQGLPVEAAGAHEYALIALRAYRAEMDDPEPEVEP